MLSVKDRQDHIKARSKNILCSESNGSQVWLPLQVKIETKARFLAKRLVEATGDLTNKKIVVLISFITFIKTSSEKTFITYKKQEVKFFCGESNRSQRWLLLQAKFETSGSNFSQETRQGLLAATHTKEILLLAFYSP